MVTHSQQMEGCGPSGTDCVLEVETVKGLLRWRPGKKKTGGMVTDSTRLRRCRNGHI